MTGKLTTIKRDDGTMQVAYKGRRSTTSWRDQAAGDTNGQGIEAFVIAAP